MRSAQAAAGARQVQLGFHFLDQAQVGQLGLAVRRHQNVVGLDVAMDQLFLVGPVQSLSDLGDQPDRIPLGHLAFALDLAAQRFAVDKLHHQVGGRARITVFEGLDDVGVVELLGRLVLLLEAFQENLVARHVGGDNLDGDDLPGKAMSALVDRPHAPLGNALEQFIIADDLQGRTGSFQGHRAHLH